MARVTITDNDARALREAVALLLAAADAADDPGRFNLCAIHLEAIERRTRTARRLWQRPRRPAAEQTTGKGD
ncbi:hypothetical protein GHK68_24360 [Sinorhizobium meliloti]|uniref:hypothetical protein n=1 Tax=Rhizobium meliloti TaxID=382 RepID=UPI001295788D|nr:hypothetical protein [Sinorhizobium meliloti]MQW45307.1 hypothetical protein [Sinorhizobium meliloti]